MNKSTTIASSNCLAAKEKNEALAVSRPGMFLC